MLTKFSSEYLKGKRKLRSSNRTGKGTTKMNIRTAGHFDVRWICPTQNRVQWDAVVSMVMNCVNSIKYLYTLSCHEFVHRVGYNSGHRRTV